MSKKICIVANTDWYLYNFRQDLIHTLQNQGVEPVLVSPPGDYSEKMKAQGIRHIPWKLGRKTIAFWKEFESIQQIAKIYRREKPVLVHHHTLKAVIYGSIAARQAGTPVINSIPGRGYVFSSNDVLARILRPILLLLFKLVLGGNENQRVIFENKSDMNYFSDNKILPHGQTYLIPSVGVNTKKFSPSPTSDGNFSVAFVGRLLKDKGVGVFVEAAKLLAASGENIRMILVGLPDPDNPDSYTRSQVAEWQDSGIVEWWGWQENMAEVYQRIHVLAQPTNYGEGVPTTLAEAAASQRAVIASDWPGCREIIIDQENGILVPPKDPAALADAILYLAKQRSEYDRMRMALYHSALDKFSTVNVNSQTLSIYRELLNKGLNETSN
jgi:glycosyltransferase involved in cell wall biosynthesis